MPKHPYEQVIRFEGLTRLKKNKTKIKRSKQGCFNCRKRKTKCDEMKPICTTCLNRCIDCVWPKEGGDKLPDEYCVPNVDQVQKNKRKMGTTFIPVEFQTIENPKLISTGLDKFPASTSSGQELIALFNLIEPVDDIGSPYSSKFSLDLENTPCLSAMAASKSKLPAYFTMSPYNQIAPDREQWFMLACINGFIKSVGPQYTHPLLTTSATFSPFVDNNSITEKVATACGCAFLAWQSPELTKLSAQKYYVACNALDGYMKSRSVDSHNENWLGAAFQLMCLCSKITWGCSASNCVDNLVNSYKLIQMKFLARSKVPNHRRFSLIDSKNKIITQDNTGINQYLKGFNGYNLKMEIENSLIHQDKFSSEYFESQFEKMFIESFIFNYSVAILAADDYYLLPNPFNVFRDLHHLLKAPLFNCDVAWMNNPVFGASLDAYELAAKSSYLLRNLNDPQLTITAKKLYDIASFCPSPMIPPEIRNNSIKYKNLRDSVLMAEIVAKAAKILLRKLIIPEISNKDDSVIQNELVMIVSKLKAIRADSKVKLIACWPLLVAGAAVTKEEHRDIITKNLVVVGEMTHGRHVYTVLDALDIAWGNNQDVEIKSRGLDILFDRRVMCKVIV